MHPQDVRSYWFGAGGWSENQRWFMMGRTIDDEIRSKFGELVEQAQAGLLDHDPRWIARPEDRVMLIIVLDQFSRHVYRDDPRFVAGDLRAQAHVQRLVRDGDDVALPSEYKFFLLTVLEHAEDLGLQDLGRTLNARYKQQHDDLDLTEYIEQHAQIIEQFGRFPDRNSLLGRASTPEEVTFLQTTKHGWFETQGEPESKPHA